MRWFVGRSTRDREHLVRTLRSLPSSTVTGLAAALSWSERRTERALRDAMAHGYEAIRFDPGSRSVAWSVPAATAPSPSVSSADPSPAPAAAVLPKSWGASPRCPSCQIAYLPTGTGAHQYCPQCGRLAPARGASPRSGDAPSTPSTSAPTAAAVPIPVALGPDRRSQELFAAWVTAQPIPCPKCRTPLRHHGVAEYACPSCGARVAFERSSGVPASTRAPAPSSAPPATASVVPPSR